MFDVESWFVVSESEVIYLLIFQTQETSAKTKSGRCRRGHLEKYKKYTCI